jgi:hypothetical protein
MTHFVLKILLLIFTGAKCEYKHVGCFKDTGNRAISGGFVVYDPSVVIRKCSERAKQKGNGFFAVQYNRECFTSHDAGRTYFKYGSSSGCRNGRGGSWAMNVYRFQSVIAETLGRVVDSKYESKWNEGVRTCTDDCEQKYNTLAGDMEMVALGIEAGSSILDIALDAIKGKKFKRIAGMMGKFAPYLGALGPVVGIIGAFGETEEMQRLNFVVNMLSEGFKQINQRFDYIQLKIHEVKNLIKKEHSDTRNYDYVNRLVNINGLVYQYFEAYAMSSSNAERKKTKLIDQEKDCWEAVETLFNAFTGRAGYGKLCISLAKSMDGHRDNVMDKVLPLYMKFVQGVSDYLLIESLIDPRNANDFQKEYEDKLRKVHNSIAECDAQMESTLWLDYWDADLLAEWGTHQKHGVDHVANKIYIELSVKYWWRDWLVAVWGDAWGSRNHWQMHCPGETTYSRRHWDKKNIIVTSVSRSKSTYAKGLRVNFPDSDKYNAKSLWERIPGYMRTCTYPVSGVVNSNYKLAIHAPEGRKYRKYIRLKKCWTKFTFTFFGKKTNWACRDAGSYNAYILG